MTEPLKTANHPSRDDIAHAYSLIKGHIRKTPMFEVDGSSLGFANPIQLKLELFQHSGSFKARGAFYNLLSRSIPGAGVAAASGGNHGAAVAHAAHQLNIPAHIFVPEISSPAKISKIRKAGAEVIIDGARYADALNNCEIYQSKTGAIGLQAYDSFETICGQGTLGLELEGQLKEDPVDTWLVAVGGGGLISGMASWFGKSAKIIGIEPANASALHQALEAGNVVDVDVSGIAADSLGAKRCGELVFEIASRLVDDTILLPDEAIAEAQASLWSDYRLATEAGGAAAFAALQSGAYRPEKDEKIGIILCGSNVELEKLAGISNCR